MAAFGNKNNWKGGVGQWPEMRFRVPPELKEALNNVDWRTSNVQALKVLKAWKHRLDEEAAAAKKKTKKTARSGS